MKYEVIKDKEDLLVLTINGIVVLISRDMSEITAEILKDHENRKINPRRTYEPAVISLNQTKPKRNLKTLLEMLDSDDKS